VILFKNKVLLKIENHTLEEQLINRPDGAKTLSMNFGLGAVDFIDLKTHFEMHKKCLDFILQSTSAAENTKICLSHCFFPPVEFDEH
jgi:hypothetical protein